MVCWRRRDVGGNRSHSGRGWHGRACRSAGAPVGAVGVDHRAVQPTDRPHGHHRRGQRPLRPVSGHLVQRGHRHRLRWAGQPARRQLLPVRVDAAAAGVPAGCLQLPAAGADLHRGPGLCRGIVPDPPVLPTPRPCGGAVLPADRPSGDREAGAHRRRVDRPAADAADRGEHGRLHQRDRGWGDGGAGGPLAAGRGGVSGRGDRAVVALLFATLFFVYQVRRFRRAAAVVPELFEGESPGMPGWSGRMGRREG